MTMAKVEHIHKRDTLPQRHSQRKSDQACCLSLDKIAARFLRCFSGRVRCEGLCSQECPLASFQQTVLSEPGRTCSGPTPFLAVSYSAASAGYNDCSELHMQAFLLAQQGQPLLPPSRSDGRATKRGGPLGHFVQIQRTTFWLPAVILSGSSPALRFLSKSNSIIAGCTCSVSSLVVCSRVY